MGDGSRLAGRLALNRLVLATPDTVLADVITPAEADALTNDLLALEQKLGTEPSSPITCWRHAHSARSAATGSSPAATLAG